MTAPAPPSPLLPATRPLAPLGKKRLSQGAWIKFAVLVAVVATAILALRFTPLGSYLTEENVRALFARLEAAWWAPLLLIGLYAALCPLGLPATPLLVGGALVFGTWLGSLYNFVGLLAGALSSYVFAKHMGGEIFEHFGGAKLRKIERALTRHGFWYLVGARFFPVPFPLVNFAMALSGIRLLPFTVSTALGLAPSVILWTYFYSSVLSAAAGDRAGKVTELLIALSILGFFSLLPGRVRRILRARRYRRLVAMRRERVASAAFTRG